MTKARRNAARAVLAVLIIAGTCYGLRRRPASLPAPAGTPSAVATRLPRGGDLIASLRSDPSSYNSYVAPAAATELVTLLTQARLVRVNRKTDDLEPWLAERWSTSDDGRTYTLFLRTASFSDGVPFTADDVLFSFQAIYDNRVNSPLKHALEVAGKPLAVSAPNSSTVVIVFPEPFAPGLRLLDNLPILPKHKLAAALASGTFADEWTPARPLDTVAGLGPFVLREHVSGQRLVFSRNPHFFRRDAEGNPLPYLDGLTVLIVPEQPTETLRLQAGETDLMSNGEIPPPDYASYKQLESAGRLRLHDIGTSLDPDMLWFNLSPRGTMTPGRKLLAQKGFRQAISYGVDRQQIVDAVYLGAATPIFGPITPGNRTWYLDDPSIRIHDPAKARALLGGLGLRDGNGDGMLEHPDGSPVRFSMLSQSGHIRGRTAAALKEQLRKLGVLVDLVTLDSGGMFQRFLKADYDSIYFATQASSTDPALNLDFWLSSGEGHLWNPGQSTPSSPWEARIDTLMREQSQNRDLSARQRAFAEVQRIFAEELPAIYFVAARVTVPTTPRVLNPTPVLQLPQLLWSADTLASAPAGATR
jgi:peptide/nickel transport system substrate-binding protein